MNNIIRNLIIEQFNINGMNLNGSTKHNNNIFNKKCQHPYYNKLLDGLIDAAEIEELNGLQCVATAENKSDLQRIVEYYSSCYPNESLNWLDVTGITDMSHLFDNGYMYNGDIS